MLRKNDEITLTIDGMTSEGSGIGHYDGQAVFVAGTAVGDVILCHIIKAKKTYAVGKAFKIFTSSKDRVPADCEVSNRCGGCCYRHISYDAELQYKQQRVADAFSRLGHLDVEVEPVTGSPLTEGYRNKAQFPVGLDRDYNPVMGFYAANTHRIVPCMDCKLQPEVFGRVLEIVRKWIIKAGVKIYDESKGIGLLRHIYLRQGYYSKELMVCLVINGDKINRTKSLVEALEAKIPEFKTLVVNINKARNNVILGDRCEVYHGDGYITDELLGKKFRIGPLSFYQVNTLQTEQLYRKAAEYALAEEGGEYGSAAQTGDSPAAAQATASAADGDSPLATYVTASAASTPAGDFPLTTQVTASATDGDSPLAAYVTASAADGDSPLAARTTASATDGDSPLAAQATASAAATPAAKGSVLLDLYCGIGTIGLTMADKFEKLYGVEIIPEAIENAKYNAEANGIDNATFICGDAAAAAEALRADGVAPTVVLVDPPRKGLAPELIDTINEFAPKRVVYVSCDPATLARDCARFNELGYTVERVTPFDMYPRTSHVENVVLLRK